MALGSLLVHGYPPLLLFFLEGFPSLALPTLITHNSVQSAGHIWSTTFSSLLWTLPDVSGCSRTHIYDKKPSSQPYLGAVLSSLYTPGAETPILYRCYIIQRTISEEFMCKGRFCGPRVGPAGPWEGLPLRSNSMCDHVHWQTT